MNNKRFEIGASEQPLDIIKETCGFAGIFKQIGVIGDSLASGGCLKVTMKTEI